MSSGVQSINSGVLHGPVNDKSGVCSGGTGVAVDEDTTTNTNNVQTNPKNNNSVQTSPKLFHRRNRSSMKSTSSGSSSDGSGVLKLQSPSSPPDSLTLEDSVSRSSESAKSNDSSRSLETTTTTKEPVKEKKSSEKKRKSSSWYNVLNPSYKSRTEDFKRLFKDLPDTERLVVDYSCALQKDILVHGRLYISQNFVCFHANIFRWETYLTIRCEDITSISKEKTALVIPNAIQICTNASEKYFFTSFGSREKTYLMLFRIWQNALLRQPMIPQELWQWIHVCYGDDLGLTSDDDDYISPLTCSTVNGYVGTSEVNRKSKTGDLTGDLDTNNSGASASTLPLGSNSHMGDVSATLDPEEEGRNIFLNDSREENGYDGAREDDTENHGSKTHSRTGSGAGGDGVTTSDDLLNRQSSKESKKDSMSRPRPDNLILAHESEDENDIGEVTCNCESHEGRGLMNCVLPLPADAIFTMLFTNSKFLSEFHALRKMTDVVHSAWQDHQQDGKTRQVTYTLQVNIGMTVKAAQTTETQILNKVSKVGQLYIIDVDAITPGLPYGDTFYTHHRYCITRVSADECRLVTHSQIKYKKSVWGLVKSFIERNAWSGLAEFYKEYEASLIKEATNAALSYSSSIKPKVRRRRRLVTGEMNVETPDKEPETPICQEPLWRIPPTNTIKDASRSNAATDILVPIILIILILLLVLNALLYYKLWALEATDVSRQYVPGYFIDPEVLKKPRSNDDWIQLIQQQEALHNAEVTKWREVIDTVISLLQEMEESLVSLKHDVQPYGNYDGPLPKKNSK